MFEAAIEGPSDSTIPRRAGLSDAPASASPAPERYGQLPKLDQNHAESLTRSCRLTPEAQQLSRELAARDLLQTCVTSIPLILCDFVTLWALMVGSSALVERICSLPKTFVTRDTALVAAALLIPIVRLAGLYPALGMSPVMEFRQLVRSAATALCIFSGIGMVAHPEYWTYYLLTAMITMLLTAPILPAARFTIRCIMARFEWWGSTVLVYGPADVAQDLYLRLRSMNERGLRPAAVLLTTEDYWDVGEQLEQRKIPVFDVRNVLDVARQKQATWLLLANDEHLENHNSARAYRLDEDLNAIPNRVLLSSGKLDCGMWDRAHTIGHVGGLWLSNLRYCGWRALLKRAADIVVAAVALLIASPVLLAIIAAIRLTSPGPIFYSQGRVGRRGIIFPAWKFRSMVPNADQILRQHLDSDPGLRREWTETHKLKNDPRVTRVGRLLRATSLDELPQLWNILRGDMSVVGPRPIVDSVAYDATYVHDYPHEYAAYITMRPGLTGLWQVTCRNSGVYELRIYWDMYYIRNWSLWLDFYIILRTIRTVLLREGAY